MSSLGESGLSVFQAGHCDWQRPHSVQEVKSRMPFQLKSSIEPTPRVESSSRSSMSSSETALSSEVSGLTAPRAVRPEDSRLNQMLKNARNRCQATPIVRLTEIVIIQMNEIRILTLDTR